MNNKVYSMPLTTALLTFNESKQQLSITSDLLLDELTAEGTNTTIGLLCENFCVNQKIAEEFEQILIYSPMVPSEADPEVEEIIVPPESLIVLEAALIARHHVIKSLNMKNISLSLH